MSNERQAALAERLKDQLGTGAPPPAAPPAPPAAAPAPAPVPPVPVSDEDSERKRFTYYLDAELGDKIEEHVNDLFWDARGSLQKGDIHTAIVAAGFEQWGRIRHELSANPPRR